MIELILTLSLGVMALCILAIIYLGIKIMMSTYRINKLDEQIMEAKYKYAVSEKSA